MTTPPSCDLSLAVSTRASPMQALVGKQQAASASGGLSWSRDPTSPPHPGPVASRPLQHDLNKGASLLHC